MTDKQCPSCGGNCGRTIKSGCMYDNPVERKLLRVTTIAQREEIERLRKLCKQQHEALVSFTKSDYIKKQHPVRYKNALAALAAYEEATK